MYSKMIDQKLWGWKAEQEREGMYKEKSKNFCMLINSFGI